jgi:hypothetical protein
MQSKCKADQFYITYKSKGSYYSSYAEYHFSIAGLMFLSELIFAGIEAAGIDPTKASIRIEKNDVKPTLAVSFPSPKTRLLHSIRVVDGDIIIANNKPDPTKKKRKNQWGYYSTVKRDSRKFPLADPKLSENIAAFIKQSLPKKSIYAVEETLTTEPAPDA